MPAKTILKGRLNAIRLRAELFETIEEGERNIGGFKAPSITFKQKLPGKDSSVIVNSILVREARGYLFVFAAPENQFKELEFFFNKIIGSFEFTR